MSAKKQTTATAKSLQSGDSASKVTRSRLKTDNATKKLEDSVSPKIKDNTTMVSRPRRKPDHSVKGTMKTWEGTDYCEFHPVGKRESNRTEIKRVGDSSFYQTNGEKESSYSLHVNVDGDSQDPVAEIYEIMDVLTRDKRKQLPKLPEGSEGRMLLDDGNGLQIWLDTAKGEVNILARLECSPNIERMLLQSQAAMNVCVARHRSEILNHELNK